MSGARRIAVLPGDGVGAEVVAGPTELLEAVAAAGRIELTGPWPVGASAFGELGTGLPEPTLAACDDCDAMFFGAAGEHPGVSLDDYRPEHSIIGLR
ncbi:MAG: 3-isopropylmalate dehydrogenase, partial [Acidimicrobiaceae bacterium]|nr:3-isopropylmalate dehydrogenase [Acidimicrobiaceae bacterium]